MYTKYRAGGPGTYTRDRGGRVWTKVGDTPVAAPTTTAQPAPATVNTSLNGVWERESGSQVTVNGNSGILSSFGTLNPRGTDAVNKGYWVLGSQNWRNLRSTGNLTWSGQVLQITYRSSSPDVATGTTWADCTITMNADGQTLGMRFTNSEGGQANTYRRVR